MTTQSELDPAAWSRVRAIFDEMADMPAAERPGKLALACGADVSLRAAVEALLASDDALQGNVAADEVPDRVAPISAVLSSRTARPDAGPPDRRRKAGESFGQYRIVSWLGEGGMGVVYEAEQASPRRHVALKLIRGGDWGDDSRRRAFQREAEALARLRHPGIAAIHETGTTDDGRPFFAMELVRGLPLDRFAAEQLPPLAAGRPALKSRIDLFLQVGDVVSHAHQHGVIHRDLKPSNILVVDEESADGRQRRPPRVKLLDFGLARIAATEGSPNATETGAGLLQGTLDYMSPEQASGDPDGIDARSDVYALGLILYELVAGERAFRLDLRDLAGSLVRIAQETPRPPGTHNRACRGDLDTIVLKALEKDPARRYQSVNALCDDLGRYLADLPIHARPATVSYQLRKLASKHRTATALSGALVLAVLLGAIGTTVGMLRARAAAQAAREEAATAAQVSQFLEEIFRVSNPSEARGNAITARELLDAGVARIDTSLVDQPRVKARLMGVMGEVYRRLGLYKDARPILEHALALKETTLGADDPEVARTSFALGGLLRRLGDYEAARGHYDRSLDIRRRQFGPTHPDVAASLTGLANLAMETGDYDTARPLYEECIRIIEASKGVDHPDLALYLSNLALLLRATREDSLAMGLARRAVLVQEKAFGPEHPDLAYDLRGLGISLAHLGRHGEARAIYRRTLAIQEKALGPDHTDVAETLGSIGDSYLLEGGHPDSAMTALRRSEAIFAKALGPDHNFTVRIRDNISVALRQQGDYAAAVALSERCLEDLVAALGPDHPSVIIVYEHLAQHHLAAGRPERAREYYGRALALADTTYGADSEESRELRSSLAATGG